MNVHQAMRRSIQHLLVLACVPLVLAGCEGAQGDDAACEDGLAAGAYDIRTSRFAFGSPPVHSVEADLDRWTGPHGTLVHFSSGAIAASLNGDAPRLPAYSLDGEKVKAHTTAYFKSMGVADCQLLPATVSAGGGAGGPRLDASLIRGIDGIVVAESIATASFDEQGKTTYEAFFWPAIPADVVDEARRFRAELADPAKLAAFKAKLPEEARGDGQVTIHHNPTGSPDPFAAIVTWDTLAGPSPLSFDTEGRPLR